MPAQLSLEQLEFDLLNGTESLDEFLYRIQNPFHKITFLKYMKEVLPTIQISHEDLSKPYKNTQCTFDPLEDFFNDESGEQLLSFITSRVGWALQLLPKILLFWEYIISQKQVFGAMDTEIASTQMPKKILIGDLIHKHVTLDDCLTEIPDTIGKLLYLRWMEKEAKGIKSEPDHWNMYTREYFENLETLKVELRAEREFIESLIPSPSQKIQTTPELIKPAIPKFHLTDSLRKEKIRMEGETVRFGNISFLARVLNEIFEKNKAELSRKFGSQSAFRLAVAAIVCESDKEKSNLRSDTTGGRAGEDRREAVTFLTEYLRYHGIL